MGLLLTLCVRSVHHVFNTLQIYLVHMYLWSCVYKGLVLLCQIRYGFLPLLAKKRKEKKKEMEKKRPFSTRSIIGCIKPILLSQIVVYLIILWYLLLLTHYNMNTTNTYQINTRRGIGGHHTYHFVLFERLGIFNNKSWLNVNCVIYKIKLLESSKWRENRLDKNISI